MSSIMGLRARPLQLHCGISRRCRRQHRTPLSSTTPNVAAASSHISYIAEAALSEAGIDILLPIVLQIDNAAYEAFINHTAFRTKLKHIDCRQEWVRMIRDKSILKPVHVESVLNLADLFTKILDRATFERLRDRMMVRRHLKHDMNELD